MRWLALVVVMAGCDLPFGPDVEYVNRRPMQPPAIYAELHARVLACLGPEYVVRRDFSAIRWYVADSITYEGRRIGEYADLRGAITMRADEVDTHWLVRHGMEHVVRQEGNEAHRPSGHLLCEHVAVS